MLGVDWQIVGRWADEIARGELADIRGAFSAKGARGPDVVWQPAGDSLMLPQLRFLHGYWTELAGTRSMPRASEIDPLGMRPALGYIMLIDPVPGGVDFRYRLYGSRIAAVSGFDVTGRRVSEHPASPYIIAFTLALYRAAVARAVPLFAEHGPPATLHTASWHRVILPLAGAAGEVARLLVGIVPIAHDGRPI